MPPTVTPDSIIQLGLFTLQARSPLSLEDIRTGRASNPGAPGVFSTPSETRGGFDYSGADCAGWMRDAGFKETRVEHLSGPDSMVVAVK